MKTRPTDGRCGDPTILAIATFTVFMHAYSRGELPKATEAQSQLERLGIIVRFASACTTDWKGGKDGKR